MLPWYPDVHLHLQLDLSKVPPCEQTTDGQVVTGLPICLVVGGIVNWVSVAMGSVAMGSVVWGSVVGDSVAGG